MAGKKPKAADGAATGPSEETKAKFREALERKRAHGGRDVSDSGATGPIHDGHGPAKAQRMFRRKSGG